MRAKVVVVEWGDAFIETDDFDIKDAKTTKPIYRSTAGYLIAENQYGYVLATDLYDKGDEAAAKMFIPHGMVTKVTEYETKANKSTRRKVPAAPKA